MVVYPGIHYVFHQSLIDFFDSACQFLNECYPFWHAFVAQSVEQLTLNQRVIGSSPIGGTIGPWVHFVV